MNHLTIRFDDLRHDRPPRCFGEPDRVITAWVPEDVVSSLQEAQRAADSGSWVAGFVSYESAVAFQASLVTHEPDPGFPLAWFGVFDRILEPSPLERDYPYTVDRWTAEVAPPEYRRDVRKVKELIRKGETYQVNYSTRLRSNVRGDHLSLYRDLARSQGGSYAAYIETDDWVVISASPELFFRWDGTNILCRPMKGTMSRGRWAEDDLAQKALLLNSEKDRAENVMIVDLIRNDLGRFAEIGTVHVESLCDAERYNTVWQLTSTVTARTPEGVGLADVFAHTFPCGSVTGAPKVRTMEIIAELERSPRGIYCGAIGLLSPPGSGEPRAQFSVAIRTMAINRHTGEAAYGVGGGITQGSSPEDEYDEARLKGLILEAPTSAITLLETMRWEPGSGFYLLNRHLQRLHRSARYFGIPYPVTDIMRNLRQFHTETTARVRLLLEQDGTVRLGHQPLGEPKEPVRVAFDWSPIDPEDPTRFHKSTNREEYEMARARQPDADDVVLLTASGEVAETTIANIAALIDGRWVTPPLSSGCLPGTHRADLIARGTIVEGVVTAHDLGNAADVAIFNSVSGWRRAKLIGSRPDPNARLSSGSAGRVTSTPTPSVLGLISGSIDS